MGMSPTRFRQLRKGLDPLAVDGDGDVAFPYFGVASHVGEFGDLKSSSQLNLLTRL